MALKSSREGLRKELVDYLGNIIIDDNLKNEIIKVVGDNFVTSESLNEIVNNLTIQITTESGERIEADDTLQNNITVEATAREGADTTLQNNITAEATAREGADTTLQNNINAETTARQEAISNLESLIGTGGKFYGIDTSIVLFSGSNSTTVSYTATQDCWANAVWGSNNNGASCLMYINDIEVFRAWNIGWATSMGGLCPVKKGQTVKITKNNPDANATLKIYATTQE